MPRAVILPPAAPPAATHFPTLSHKWQDFMEKKKKMLWNIKCVFRITLRLLKQFLILKRIQRDIATNVETSSRKISFILVGY